MRKKVEKREDGSVRVRSFTDPDIELTEQHHVSKVNINNIIDRYNRSGMLPQLVGSKPMFGDFSSGDDYHDACDKVIKAQNAFMSLPAKVRSRFKNDPENLFEFLSDENNRKEAVELGLIPREVPKEVMEVRVVSDSSLESGKAPVDLQDNAQTS